MSWFSQMSEQSGFNFQRNSNYERGFAISLNEVNKMVNSFDGLFSNFIDYNTEISSLILFPFDVSYGEELYLTTNKSNDTKVRIKELETPNIFLGSAFISTHFNNFLDYDGYTSIKLKVPFADEIGIKPSLYVGRYIKIYLTYDTFTGDGCYFVGWSNTPSDDGDFTLTNTIDCQLGMQIPLGSSNKGDILRNALLSGIKTASAVGLSVATKSALPMTIASRSEVVTESVRGSAPYSRLRAMNRTETESTVTTQHVNPANNARNASDIFNMSVDALNYSSSSSANRSSASVLVNSRLTPYIKIMIYRPKVVDYNANFGLLYGFPVGKVLPLSVCHGYTEISAIHLEGEGFETATQSELAELETMLKNGVILPEYDAPIIQYKTIRVINENYPQSIVSYTMPTTFTWTDFVGSEYDTDNKFSITGTSVYYDTHLIKDTNSSVSPEGDYYYEGASNTTTLTIINSNNQSERETFTLPINYTWVDFVNSEYNTDHKFTYSGDNIYYNDFIVRGILNPTIDVAEGDYYYEGNSPQYANRFTIDGTVYETNATVWSVFVPQHPNIMYIGASTTQSGVSIVYYGGTELLYNGQEVLANSDIINGAEYYTTINFYIDDIQYRAKYDSYWYEWVDSEYNTNFIPIMSSVPNVTSPVVISPDGSTLRYNIKNENEVLVVWADKIISSGRYTLVLIGGSSD